MVKMDNPEFDTAKFTIKGEHETFIGVLAGVMIVILSVVFMIIMLEAKRVVTQEFIRWTWIIYTILMSICVILIIVTILRGVKIRRRVCLAVYENSIVGYDICLKRKNAYYRIDIDEIEQYGFIPVLSKFIGSRPKMPSDILNFGKCRIILKDGIVLNIPVADIKKTRDYLKMILPMQETIFCRYLQDANFRW